MGIKMRDIALVILIVAVGCICHRTNGNCVMTVKNEETRKAFDDHINSEDAKLLIVTLKFSGSEGPNSTEWMNYRPQEWKIAKMGYGLDLVTSHPDIDFFSVGFFTIGVKKLVVNIDVSPVNCLRNISENDFNSSVLNLFYSRLKSSDARNASVFEDGTQICSEKALLGGISVKFRTICCKSRTVCKTMTPDTWQKFFFYSIFLLNFVVFLYIANLVPEYFYREKYSYKNFLYKLPYKAHFRVLDKTSEVVATDAKLETEALQAPESGQTCQMTNLHDIAKGSCYSIDGIWFKVPDNRLVSKAYLPIGLFTFLYQRLIKCNCYTYRGHVKPPIKQRTFVSDMDVADSIGNKDAEDQEFNVRICCEQSICYPAPKIRFPTWSTVLRVLMSVCSSIIFAIPWILIYALDDNLPEGKRGLYARERSLIYSPSFYVFNILRFLKITIPGLSLAMMILYVLSVCIISVIFHIDDDELEYVGKRVRSTLRRARDRWDEGVIKSSRLYIIVFLPFKYLRKYGLLALILWPIWVVTACPFMIFFVLFGNTPTVNIFLRLLIMFSKDIISIFRNKQIRNDAGKSARKLILYFSVIVALIIAHFFIFALVSLLVNIVAYTLAGAIVTANDTTRYTTFVILIALNARDSFLSVEERYAIFYNKLQAAVLDRMKDNIKDIARRCQLNSAFKISSDSDTDSGFSQDDELWNNVAISVKNKVLWNSLGVVQFLDHDDKIYLSEKFFFDTCYMDYYGCPGDFATSLFDATKRVFIIILFLIFVMFTLNAYGGLASNSASGLLITLSWGLLPLLINRFFSRPIPELSLDTDDYNFQNKLDNVLSNFHEYWEVVDFNVTILDQPIEKHDVKTSVFWLKLSSENSVQLAVRTTEDHEANIPESPSHPNDIELKMVEKKHEENDTCEL